MRETQQLQKVLLERYEEMNNIYKKVVLFLSHILRATAKITLRASERTVRSKWFPDYPQLKMQTLQFINNPKESSSNCSIHCTHQRTKRA